MKSYWIFGIGVAAGMVAMGTPQLARHLHGARSLVSSTTREGVMEHTAERFEFTANGPMERVAPLFGADRERVWAPEWNPEFVSPATPADVRGMVFQVQHGDRRAVWVNTEFDLKAGRMQYAYVIPDKLVTLITIRLTPQEKATRVEVEYERTALSVGANEHVRHLAENDRKSGPEWERQINEYLGK